MLTSVLQLPEKLTFSFVKEVMLQWKPTDDQSFFLVQRCETVALELFALLGLPVPHREQSLSQKSAFFDIELHALCFNAADAHFEITLERMINGHLGCNEDNLSLAFNNGKQSIKGRCYLFKGDPLTLDIDGFDDALQIEALFARALRA